MQEEIQKIIIILENCECITVEGKHIGDLNIKNISFSIRRVACNSIQKMYCCSEFAISIHADCSLNKKSEWTLGEIDAEERDPIERLYKCNDITSVDIYFNTGECQQVFVPWNEEDDYTNKYQKTYINKFGDLYIVVSKNTEFDDVFDREEIEDISRRAWTWGIYEALK